MGHQGSLTKYTKTWFLHCQRKRKKCLWYIQKLHTDDKNVFDIVGNILTKASNYNKDDDDVKWIFATIRNEMYKLAIGEIASDIVYNRADHNYFKKIKF